MLLLLVVVNVLLVLLLLLFIGLRHVSPVDHQRKSVTDSMPTTEKRVAKSRSNETSGAGSFRELSRARVSVTPLGGRAARRLPGEKGDELRPVSAPKRATKGLVVARLSGEMLAVRRDAKPPHWRWMVGWLVVLPSVPRVALQVCSGGSSPGAVRAVGVVGGPH